MTGDNVLLEVRDGIAHLTLNRPDAANGINDELAHDLLAATTAISLDTACRVVLLSGNGPRFCGGGDVKAFAALGDELAANIRGLIPVAAHRDRPARAGRRARWWPRSTAARPARGWASSAHPTSSWRGSPRSS